MQYVLEEDAIHFSVWDEDALSKDRHSETNKRKAKVLHLARNIAVPSGS